VEDSREADGSGHKTARRSPYKAKKTVPNKRPRTRADADGGGEGSKEKLGADKSEGCSA